MASLTIFERVKAAYRAFVLGEGVVDRADMAWGRDPATFAPPEYGEYLATSNGVYVCTSLRADLLSSVPFKLYKTGGGQNKEVTTGQLYDLMQKVNPHWTWNRLVKMTEMSLGVWGANFWFLERGTNGRGVPKEIWWGKSDRVRVVPHPTKYISGFIYDSIIGEQLYFEPHEVIWFRYANPMDEYAGLSPLAAARLAADYASAAMKSNKALFDRGMSAAGFAMPVKGQPQLSVEQAQELEEKFHKRFTGQDKAHRWGVLRFEAELKAMNVTPREAEFSEGLKFSLEEIARAYKVPLDLIGGQRTYTNVEAAHKAIWTHCLQPEAMMFGDELTEQLLPMFPGEADLIEADLSKVAVLQEEEGEQWTREQGQITVGAITINEWRKQKNLPAVPWGDAWWRQGSLAVTHDDSEPEPPPPPVVTVEESAPKQLPAPKEERGHRTRLIAYGGDEHTRLWKRYARRTDPHEARFAALCEELFKRQRDSVLSRLSQRGARAVEDAAEEPFKLSSWILTFRVAVRPLMRLIAEDGGATALDDLELGDLFNVDDPRMVRFLEQRAQRFAQSVNETTWNALKASLAEGIAAGEGTGELAERVERVMEGRIRSSKEAIARTEVNGAYNGGTLAGWRQSGVVIAKEWLSTLDDRLRGSHAQAHGQRVGLDDEFVVGNGSGPHPGAIGLAEEDIQCRCTMVAVLDTEW